MSRSQGEFRTEPRAWQFLVPLAILPAGIILWSLGADVREFVMPAIKWLALAAIVFAWGERIGQIGLRGRRLMDIGPAFPRPLRLLRGVSIASLGLIIASELWDLATGNEMLFFDNWFTVVSLIALMSLMGWGRCALHEAGMWTAAGLVPWHRIASWARMTTGPRCRYDIEMTHGRAGSTSHSTLVADDDQAADLERILREHVGPPRFDGTADD